MDEIKKADFAQFQDENEHGKQEKPPVTPEKIDKILDVELEATVVLGRSRISIENALYIDNGSLIELDKTAGEPVELLINGKLFARGEVVVIDNKYGIRITEMVDNTSISTVKK